MYTLKDSNSGTTNTVFQTLVLSFFIFNLQKFDILKFTVFSFVIDTTVFMLGKSSWTVIARNIKELKQGPMRGGEEN